MAERAGISGVRVYRGHQWQRRLRQRQRTVRPHRFRRRLLHRQLVPGTYTARVDTTTLPAGLVQTYDAVAALDHAATFFVSANQTRTDIDFGYTSHVTIGDLVWNDRDGDGQKDSGETGLAGVTVTVYNAANDTVAGTMPTDSNGAYSFTNLLPGTYYVVFDPLPGYHRTIANIGADVSDSDANPVTGRTPNVTLTGGLSDLTLDAGYYQPGTITGTVLADIDNNNTGDTSIAGVLLTLKDSSGNDIDSDPNTAGVQPTTTTTNASGVYTFSGLRPGSYRIVETHPAGFLNVSDVDGLNNNIIGDQTPIILTGGQTITGRYFVEEQPGIISGTVFADTNNDNLVTPP